MVLMLNNMEDIFLQIDEEMVKEVFDSFDKNNIQLEHNISVQDVLDSYLVVGAVDKKEEKWNMAIGKFF